MESQRQHRINYPLRNEIKKALADLRIVKYTMLMSNLSHEKIDKVMKMLEEIYEEIK